MRDRTMSSVDYKEISTRRMARMPDTPQLDRCSPPLGTEARAALQGGRPDSPPMPITKTPGFGNGPQSPCLTGSQSAAPGPSGLNAAWEPSGNRQSLHPSPADAIPKAHQVGDPRNATRSRVLTKGVWGDEHTPCPKHVLGRREEGQNLKQACSALPGPRENQCAPGTVNVADVSPKTSREKASTALHARHLTA